MSIKSVPLPKDLPFTISKPIVFFDLETTGLDMMTDEIIEIAGIRLDPAGHCNEFDYLIKPMYPISPEISEITGITNEMVKDAPAFRDVVLPILTQFSGDADLAGHNVKRFDAPFLKKKIEQNGAWFSLDERSFIDTQIIYHKYESRHLTDAVRLYCNKDHDGAHRAFADAKASFDVLLGQIAYYKWPNPISVLELAKESEQSNSNFLDSGRKLFWKNGEVVLNFGKYRSRSLRDLLKNHRDYLEWLTNQSFEKDFMGVVSNALKGQFPIKKK
jgi:DNA polymerase III subunit epsilon